MQKFKRDKFLPENAPTSQLHRTGFLLNGGLESKLLHYKHVCVEITLNVCKNFTMFLTISFKIFFLNKETIRIHTICISTIHKKMIQFNRNFIRIMINNELFLPWKTKYSIPNDRFV